MIDGRFVKMRRGSPSTSSELFIGAHNETLPVATRLSILLG